MIESRGLEVSVKSIVFLHDLLLFTNILALDSIVITIHSIPARPVVASSKDIN
jgi:hypothetical protein